MATSNPCFERCSALAHPQYPSPPMIITFFFFSPALELNADTGRASLTPAEPTMVAKPRGWGLVATGPTERPAHRLHSEECDERKPSRWGCELEEDCVRLQSGCTTPLVEQEVAGIAIAIAIAEEGEEEEEEEEELFEESGNGCEESGK